MSEPTELELKYETALGRLTGNMRPEKFRAYTTEQMIAIADAHEWGRETFGNELHALRAFVRHAHDEATLDAIQAAARQGWPFKAIEAPR